MVLTVLLRNQRIAIAVCVLVFASSQSFSDYGLGAFSVGLVLGAMLVFLLMRFGFLAVAVGYFAGTLLFYFGRVFFVTHHFSRP